MPKILCPHCGTTNTLHINPLANCTGCKKRLPLRLPRTWVYAVRTGFKPAMFLIALAAIISLTPAYKALREFQTITSYQQ